MGEKEKKKTLNVKHTSELTHVSPLCLFVKRKDSMLVVGDMLGLNDNPL